VPHESLTDLSKSLNAPLSISTLKTPLNPTEEAPNILKILGFNILDTEFLFFVYSSRSKANSLMWKGGEGE